MKLPVVAVIVPSQFTRMAPISSVVPSDRTTAAPFGAVAVQAAEAVFAPTQPSAITAASATKNLFNRFISLISLFFNVFVAKIVAFGARL
jgi:hypothetical protein